MNAKRETGSSRAPTGELETSLPQVREQRKESSQSVGGSCSGGESKKGKGLTKTLRVDN